MRRRNDPGRHGAVGNDMIGKSSSLTAAQAEQLLDAARAGRGAEADPLAQLMAAAAAPAQADELRGEDEALRAFRLALRAPAPARTVTFTPARHRPRWTWALLAKLIAVLLAATGAGWALAATSGMAPNPFWDPDPPPAPSDSASDRRPTSGDPQSEGAPGASPSDDPSADPSTDSSADPSESDGVTPSASGGSALPAGIFGLCQAYIAQGEDLSVMSINSQYRLVQAAGSPEKVSAYCRELLGLPAPSPTAEPSPEPSAS